MIKSLVPALLFALCLTADAADGPQQAPLPAVTAASGPDQATLSAGFRALDGACFTCHSPDASIADPVAPPMSAIKAHYVDELTTYAGFREALGRFVNDPSAENARMPGAIQRFGLMPALGLDAVLLDQIAHYIFYTPLERPGWYPDSYADHRREYRQPVAPLLRSRADYLKHGRQLAMRSKSELGSNLKRALQDGGAVPAIRFCRSEAVPITTEMSAQLGAGIRRVSDRPRNPDNQATGPELTYIEAAKGVLADGGMPEPALRETGNSMVGYYPIVTNDMCLQCHGAPGRDIADATLAALRTAYPDDRATGYAAQQIRGIWVIDMGKDRESGQ